MKIGYACTPVSLNLKTTRSFMLKNFNYDRFCSCVYENLEDLLSILQFNIDNGIHMFRISSNIIPFGSHEINNINWQEIFKKDLLNIGKFINSNNIRVSMHPGQYTILNSPKEDVVSRGILDLEYHTSFLDSLEVPYDCKIVLHLGGVYDGKDESIKRFIDNFYKLSSSCRKRLVLENDEKCYNIKDILKVCETLNIPAIFDNLHHKINPSMNNDIDTILHNVKNTWKIEDGKMKLHYSDQDPNKRQGAHSPFVITKNFLNYLSIVNKYDADIMLETKDKELSAIKCLNSTLNTKKGLIYDEWAKYKYSVMEKNYCCYKKCQQIIKSNYPLAELYNTIDETLLLPLDEGNFKNTLMHVWGYVKDKISEKEKNTFFEAMNNNDLLKCKNILKRFCEKYNAEYLLKSYYFIY